MKIDTQNNNMSFTGRYQGLSKVAGELQKSTDSPMIYSCVYADRKMFSVVEKLLQSPKKSKSVRIFIENESETNYLSIIAKRKDVKKSLPLFLRLTDGEWSLSLSSPNFWKIINDKKIDYIKYQINQSDVKKMIRDFTSPYFSIITSKSKPRDNSIKTKMLHFVSIIKDKMPKNNNNFKKLDKMFAPARKKENY